MPADRPLTLEWVAPETLASNPKNWRRHPEFQREALGASLDECGWAGALLYNRETGRLIDGHARKDEALRKGIPFVPVLVGSWPPPVEAKILATLDPIGGLAQTDPAQLADLLKDIETGHQALAALLSQLAEEAKVVVPPDAGDPTADTGGEPPGDPPAADGRFLLRVVCPSEAKRTDLMAALRAEGYDAAPM